MSTSDIELEGQESGLDFQVVAQSVGHRCGYVRIPEGHPLFGLDYNDKAPGLTKSDLKHLEIGKRGPIALFIEAMDDSDTVRVETLFDVHGSLTYADSRNGEDGTWWLGFDCMHLGDAKDPDLMSAESLAHTYHSPWDADAVVRSKDYVEAECRSLAKQIVKWYGAVE